MISDEARGDRFNRISSDNLAGNGAVRNWHSCPGAGVHGILGADRMGARGVRPSTSGAEIFHSGQTWKSTKRGPGGAWMWPVGELFARRDFTAVERERIRAAYPGGIEEGTFGRCPES